MQNLTMNRLTLAMTIAVMSFTMPAFGLLTWTGNGDGSNWRGSSDNWSPTSGRPDIGEDFLLPTNATTQSATMNDDRDYGDIVVDGVGNVGSTFTITTTQTGKDGGTGKIGSINGGVLIIDGQEFIIGRTEANRGNVEIVGDIVFKGTEGLNLAQMNDFDVPGGGTVKLTNGSRLEASSADSSDGPYTMEFTIRIDDNDSGEIEIGDGGSGNEDDRRVTFQQVHMGNGSTLEWDQNREGASRINFLLDGNATVNVDTEHDSDHSAYVGDIHTTVANATLTLDHTRSNNNKGTVKFVGLLDPGASPGTLTLDANVIVGDPANDKAKRVQITSDASYNWQLGAAADLIAVIGDLSIEDGFTLNIEALPGAADGTYDLFTYTGSFFGDLSQWNVNVDASIASIGGLIDTGASIQVRDLVLPQQGPGPGDAAIPEPLSAVLALTGAAILGLRRRRAC